MVSEIKLEFPKFITHIKKNNPKDISKTQYQKIGYNALYNSPHYILRSKMIGSIHEYLLKNIPDNLTLTFPIETQLIIHVPINFGDTKLLKDKETGKRYLSWKKPYKGYKGKWDIGNLAYLWLKALDDCLVKKGIIKDDSIEYLRKTSYEFIPCDTIEERKLVYRIKTIK